MLILLKDLFNLYLNQELNFSLIQKIKKIAKIKLFFTKLMKNHF